MKKLVSLVLALALCLSATSALAAGKLNVLQENYYTINSFWTYGYAFAKVENSGNKPIRVNAGVLEIYDEAGDVITSTDYLSAHYAYLQPGEYTYIRIFDEIEGADTGIVVDDHMLTLTGKSESSYVYQRFPCEAKLELNVVDGWMTYNYMYATVTNDTTETVYDLNVVFALMDETGNILFVESDQVYDVGLTPNSSMVFRVEIPSSFTEYFTANNITPTTLDVIAYTEEFE